MLTVARELQVDHAERNRFVPLCESRGVAAMHNIIQGRKGKKGRDASREGVIEAEKFSLICAPYRVRKASRR